MTTDRANFKAAAFAIIAELKQDSRPSDAEAIAEAAVRKADPDGKSPKLVRDLAVEFMTDAMLIVGAELLNWPRLEEEPYHMLESDAEELRQAVRESMKGRNQ